MLEMREVAQGLCNVPSTENTTTPNDGLLEDVSKKYLNDIVQTVQASSPPLEEHDSSEAGTRWTESMGYWVYAPVEDLVRASGQ